MSPSRASRNRDEMGIEGWKRGLKGMKGRKKEGQRQAMWLFALISVHLLTFSLAIVRYATDQEIHTIDQPRDLLLWQLFQ